MFVIAADGSGDFISMAQAAQALPITVPALVVYREGEHEEDAVFPQKGLRLVGEHRDRTKVRGRVALTGEGAEVSNMTFLGDADCPAMRDCVWHGQIVNNAPEHPPCTFLLGDRVRGLPTDEATYDCRMPGYSVKRFITEMHFNYAELCFLAGDTAVYQLSDADCGGDASDATDPFLVYPLYLAMLTNAAQESGVVLRFLLEDTRADAHAQAARAFCRARNIPID